MGAREFGKRNVGSVRAAISMYGERTTVDDSSALEKREVTSSLEGSSSSRAKELLQVRKDIDCYEESRRKADSVKARAETELLAAKKTVKNLKSLIEESDSKAKLKTRDFEKLRRPARYRGRSQVDTRYNEPCRYEEVMRELEIVKQELSKLKFDVASVLEEKSLAEKEAEASSSKVASYSSSVEALTKEIEEVNEEQVLVELARIEALKELAGIEALREKEAGVHLAAVEEAQGKIMEVNEEIDRSKEIEAKLAVTMSDIEVLQVGLELARDMQKRGDNFPVEDESQASLRAVRKELEQAKKELASISEEGFQFMASMDVIRNELRHVIEETMRLKKDEERVDSTIQSSNSKLLRAKSKLEAVTAAEEKANLIASNLSATLERLRAESEAGKKEKELIEVETAKIKAEIEKTESGIDLTEEKLQAAMQELEEAKTAEALALEMLGPLIERTARDRSSASKYGSHITISKFEYDYLMGRATGAEDIADKKVAAAQAWIEALKASEKEILMKSGMANREVREMRVQEEQQVYRTERSLSAKKKVEGELNTRGMARNVNSETEYLPLAFPRSTPRRVSGDKTYSSPLRKVRVRKSGSTPSRYSQTGRSTSITLKRNRRQKVMPNISKFFSGKKSENSEVESS